MRHAALEPCKQPSSSGAAWLRRPRRARSPIMLAVKVRRPFARYTKVQLCQKGESPKRSTIGKLPSNASYRPIPRTTAAKCPSGEFLNQVNQL